MKFIPYIISLSLSAGFVAEAGSRPGPASGLAVQTCTGGIVYIDFERPDEPPLPPAHKLKPCHAICCSDETDADGLDDEGDAAA